MDQGITEIKKESVNFGWKIQWTALFTLLHLHLGAIYAIYLAITSARWQTIVMAHILGKLMIFKMKN